CTVLYGNYPYYAMDYW
nr:immunoglobulin heavy chain junction region [Mus musculus]